MNDREKLTILEVIPYTDDMSFREFCSEYPDTPAKGEKSEWSALFSQLRELKKEGLLRIEEEEVSGKQYKQIAGLRLTQAGRDWVKEKML